MRSIVHRLIFAIVLALPLAAVAAQERYEYDALGRLTRMIDGQGRVTEYVYDAVGNILEVRAGGAALAPSVASVSPVAMRRGSSAGVTIAGTNLGNVQVQAADAQLQISAVAATATSVTFNLAVGPTATLGASAITLRNAAGAASTSISVQPTLPVASIAPTPLAIPPDNVARGFTVALSHADLIAHTLNVSSDQPTIASVSPASAVIAAGQTQANFQITGRLGGQTIIRVSSPTLAPIAIPVFVTAEFRGISTAYSPIVGVTIPSPPLPPPAGVPTSLFSRAVSVTFGPAWFDTAPRGLIAGTNATLTINGAGLPATGLAISAVPATGLSFGTPSVNPGGTQASVPVTIAADAAFGPRRIVLQAGAQRLVAARLAADVVSVVPGAPEVTSVSPIFGTAGTTITPFFVRGRNLFDAQSIIFSGIGIQVGAAPQVDSTGTAITTAIEISAVAAPGARTVSVLTPAGSTSTAPSSANTFSVVQNVGASYADISAAIVGVNVGAAPPAPTSQSTSLFAAPVGIGLGSVVNSVTPNNGATGQSLTLVFAGRDLNGVTGVSMQPPDGLTLGTPVVAPDGRSVAVSVGIAADAAFSLRRISLLAGAARVLFAAPDGDRFNVTAPQPVLASVDPLIVQVGNTVGLVVRGRNFQGATQLKVTPATGITFGTLGVNPAGEVVSALMVVDAAAATGPRVVSLVTPAGESSNVAGPTNTLTLSAIPGTTYLGIAAPLVGVELAGPVTPPPAPTAQAIHSPLVGIEYASVTPPSSSTFSIRSPEIGVAVGPVASAVEPLGFNVGESGNVIVRGIGLPGGTSVSFVPATGIALNGAAVVAADGSSVTQAITVAADAPQQLRGVRLVSGGAPIRFMPPHHDSTIAIAAAPPEVVSLSAILARQGESLSLTVRGENFGNFVEVFAEPATGLVFGTLPTVAADGSTVTLSVFVSPDAALGSRVIRVRTRSGTSSATAAPANTFTVFPP